MTQTFLIRQLYLKDLSYQAPTGAAIFTQDWSPQVKIDVKVSHSAVPGGLTEVVLTLAVVGTSAGATVFMVEVMQAGVFAVSGYDGEALDRLLLGTCPTILLPYAREAIDSVLMKGRFPALILDPIDFEANWRALKTA